MFNFNLYKACQNIAQVLNYIKKKIPHLMLYVFTCLPIRISEVYKYWYLSIHIYACTTFCVAKAMAMIWYPPFTSTASKRRRKQTLTCKKAARKSFGSNDSADKDNFMYNTCSSVDCLHPHNQDKLVDWVQCDDCDDWYHVKCTGLTLKSVQPKSAKFHCGCV